MDFILQQQHLLQLLYLSLNSDFSKQWSRGNNSGEGHFCVFFEFFFFLKKKKTPVVAGSSTGSWLGKKKKMVLGSERIFSFISLFLAVVTPSMISVTAAAPFSQYESDRYQSSTILPTPPWPRLPFEPVQVVEV